MISSSLLMATVISYLLVECLIIPKCENANCFNLKQAHRECFCEEDCTLYGDCCPDVQVPLEYVTLSRCVAFDGRGVLLVNRCQPKSLINSGIKEKCQSSEGWRDLLTMVPVTNLQSKTSYLNYYCALCNGDYAHNMLWNLSVELKGISSLEIFPFNSTNLLQNLSFYNNHWGVWTTNLPRKFYPLDLVPQIPTLISNRRCEPSFISSCPFRWKDMKVERRCSMHSNPVFSGNKVFKNVDCALCNGESVSNLSCYPRRRSPFSDGGVSNKSNTVGLIVSNDYFFLFHCNNMTYWDPIKEDCVGFSYKEVSEMVEIQNKVSRERRQLSLLLGQNTNGIPLILISCIKIPLELDEYQTLLGSKSKFHSNLTLENEWFLKDKDVTYTCIDFLEGDSNAITYQNASFLNDCRKKVYQRKDSIILPNNSLFLLPDNVTSEDYLFLNQKVYVCDPDLPLLFSEFDENYYEYYERIFLTLDNIATFISVASLLFHLIFFTFIPELRNLPGLNLASLSVSLILFYVFEIWEDNIYLSSYDDKMECVILGAFNPYFLMVSIFWMNAIAFDICRTLRLATKSLRVAGEQGKWKRFFIYSLYSWILPLVPLTLVLVFELCADIPPSLRTYFSPPHCEAGNEYPELFLFYLPSFVVLLLNLGFFGASAWIIYSNVMKAQGGDSMTQKIHFSLYLRLAIVMGITWLILAIADFTNNFFAVYITEIINKLQGLFIFLCFTCFHPKVRRCLLRKKSEHTTRSSTLPDSAECHSLTSFPTKADKK